MVFWLWTIIHEVWTTEKNMPEEWKTAVIFPIQKKEVNKTAITIVE